MTDEKGRTALSRRGFIMSGVATFGSGMLLGACVAPTECSGDETPPGQELGSGALTKPTSLDVTEDNILGPYYRAGAPYRAKIGPPLAPGKVVVVAGRVWGHDTKKPLPGATVHIWQADAKGRYDNEDADNPPKAGIYRYRARMMSDEQGYYEFESIHPGRYRTGGTFRPAHIHYYVEAPGYEPLTTQLYFKGDPFNEKDRFIKPSLIVPFEERKVGATGYSYGVFHVVLARKS